MFFNAAARRLAASAALVAGPGLAAHAAGKMPLIAQRPLVIPGGPGGFDWMIADAPLGRVFASHKGTKNTAVLDSKTGRLLPSIATGDAQGLVVDAQDNKLFAGDDAMHQVVALDRRTLKVTGRTPVSGPVDDMALDPKTDRLYADHDDGTEVWVLNAKSNKLLGSVEVGGAPEAVKYDAATDRLYQNVKTTNKVAVIDPNTNKVVAQWPTAPLTSPHGLVIDPVTRRVFTAGEGRLDVMDIRTGHILQVVTIAPNRVDQIAFDPGLRRIYCSCAGFISVVQETKTGATLLANVPAPAGAHTLTVDPRTHAVWTCYADGKASYLQQFKVAP